MGKTRRIVMMVAILLTFATVVKGNYYVAENTETEGGDATTVNSDEESVLHQQLRLMKLQKKHLNRQKMSQ